MRRPVESDTRGLGLRWILGKSSILLRQSTEDKPTPFARYNLAHVATGEAQVEWKRSHLKVKLKTEDRN